jgi:hypothetical protein
VWEEEFGNRLPPGIAEAEARRLLAFFMMLAE